MGIKNHCFPDYSHIDGDDIRTIPDFYDNLYPTNDSAPEYRSCIIKKAKKTDKINRNNKKKQENSSNSQTN